MSDIIVKSTSIEITDYTFGDCPTLEKFFAIYEPVSHTYRYVGLHYDINNKILYLPRGLDVWYIESLLNKEAKVIRNGHIEFDRYSDIGMKYLPRDDDQKKALRFAVGTKEYLATQSKSQLSINLNTGKGKTYVAIGSISYLGYKSIIITYAKSVLEQWKKCILEYTNIKSNEIFDLDGKGSIFRILQRSEKDVKKIKIFLVTHSTIKSYGDAYGWDMVTELFTKLRVGCKIYDEAHTNFDNMCMIDFYTSVYKTFYLTATPARSSEEENRIYQTSYKNILAIDLFHPDTDPHTHYIAMRYNSKPTADIIFSFRNKYGLDRNKYMNYIVTNNRFLQMSIIALDFIFTNIMKSEKDKLLIYIGTNQAIAIMHNWIVQTFPQFNYDIGIFTSIVSNADKAYALSKRIILTTTKSAGAAIDIKGLKCTLVLAEPFKSEVLARQTLGRTRDKDTYYIEVVDKGFTQCNKYFLAKKPTFNTYALDCKVVEISDSDLEVLSNGIIQSNKFYYLEPMKMIKPFKIHPIKPFTIDLDLAMRFLS